MGTIEEAEDESQVSWQDAGVADFLAKTSDKLDLSSCVEVIYEDAAIGQLGREQFYGVDGHSQDYWDVVEQD